MPKRGERARKPSLSDGDKGLILEFVNHKIARGIGEARRSRLDKFEEAKEIT